VAPPQTPLRELIALPRRPSWILGGPTSKGKERRGRGEDRGREAGEKKERKGKGTKREREGREGRGAPNWHIWHTTGQVSSTVRINAPGRPKNSYNINISLSWKVGWILSHLSQGEYFQPSIERRQRWRNSITYARTRHYIWRQTIYSEIVRLIVVFICKIANSEFVLYYSSIVN